MEWSDSALNPESSGQKSSRQGDEGTADYEVVFLGRGADREAGMKHPASCSTHLLSAPALGV